MHPNLIHFGRFILPTFGVLAAAGLMAGLSLTLRTAVLVGINPDTLWNADLFTILSALVSSRLLLVVANFRSFLSYPLLILALPSLTITGICLTLIATAFYLRFKKLPLLSTLDACAPCATLVWGFLALGHQAEGSDPGLISALPWSVLSPTGGARLHPVAIYAALCAAAITLAVFRYLARRPRHGRATALALAASGTAQFLITFLRHPSFDEAPLTSILDPIQWVSLGMIVAAAMLFVQSTSESTGQSTTRSSAQSSPNGPPAVLPADPQEHHAL